MIDKWVATNKANMKSPDYVDRLADLVFQRGIDSSTFCLNVFTGVICDIFFQSGDR